MAADLHLGHARAAFTAGYVAADLHVAGAGDTNTLCVLPPQIPPGILILVLARGASSSLMESRGIIRF